MIDKVGSVADQEKHAHLDLSNITLEYDAGLLSEVLKKVQTECREMGVHVSYTTAKEFLKVNKDNRDSWPPLLTIFDPEVSGADLSSMIYIVGRKNGEIVAAQALRHFDWQNTDLMEEMNSHRLFYKDPEATRMERVGERIEIVGEDAKKITGNVAFTGAQWVRPDARERGKAGYRISELLTRAARALAIGCWNVDMTCTIMAPHILERGVAERSGYDNVDYGVIRMFNWPIFPDREVFLSLLWATRDQTLARLSRFMKTSGPPPADA